MILCAESGGDIGIHTQQNCIELNTHTRGDVGISSVDCSSHFFPALIVHSGYIRWDHWERLREGCMDLLSVSFFP